MNWRLIFGLSGFGLAMAIGTVFVIPSNIEPLFWLAIFVVCAYFVARRAPGHFFLHGLFVSLVNSFWITTLHIILFDSYVANHPAEVAMMGRMPLPEHPRVMMAIMGPIIGVISGVVLGVFCLVAAKLMRPGARAEVAG